MRRTLRACRWARPVVGTHAAGTGGDLLRGWAQLLAENALLRQLLLVLRRSVARPAVTAADRALLVLLASRIHAWRRALDWGCLSYADRSRFGATNSLVRISYSVGGR